MATEPFVHPVAQVEQNRPVTLGATRRPAQPASLMSHAWMKKLIFLLGDIAALVSAHHLAQVVAVRWVKMPVASLDPASYALFYVPFFTVILHLFEGYKSVELRRPEKELELIFKSVSVSFVGLTCANFVLFKSLVFSRYVIVEWYVLTLALILTARFSMRAVYGALWKRGIARQKALLLGSAVDLTGFQRHLSIQQHHGYDIVGILIDKPLTRGNAPIRSTVPLLGGLEEWEHVSNVEGIELIVVHLDESIASSHPRILEIVQRCQEKGIEVEIFSRLFCAAELRYERDEFSGYFRVRWNRWENPPFSKVSHHG